MAGRGDLCHRWQALAVALQLFLLGLTVGSNGEDLQWCVYSEAGQQQCELLARAAGTWGAGSGLQCVHMLDFAACLASVSGGSVDLTLAPPDHLPELPRGLALVDMHHGGPQGSGVARFRPEYALVGSKDLCQQKLALGAMGEDRIIVCQNVDCLRGFRGEVAFVTLSMLEGFDSDLEGVFRFVCPDLGCQPVQGKPCWHWQAPPRTAFVQSGSREALPLVKLANELDRLEAVSAFKRASAGERLHGGPFQEILDFDASGEESSQRGQAATRRLLQSPNPSPTDGPATPAPTANPTPAPTPAPPAPTPAPPAPTPAPPAPTPAPPAPTPAPPAPTPAPPVPTPAPPTPTSAPPAPVASTSPPATPSPTQAPATPAPTQAPATPAPTNPAPATPPPTPAPTNPPPTQPPPTQPPPTAAPTVAATPAPTQPPPTTAPSTSPPTSAPTPAPTTPAPTPASTPAATTVIIAPLNTSAPLSTPPLGFNLTVTPLVTPFLNVSQLNGTIAPAPPFIFPPPPPSNKNCPSPCPLGTALRPADLTCDCVLPMIVDLAFQRSAQQFLPNVPEFVQEVAKSTNLSAAQVSVQAFRLVLHSRRRLLQSQGQDLIVTTWLLPMATPADPAPMQLSNNQTAAITDLLLNKQLQLNQTLFGNYSVIQILPPGVKPPPPAPGTVPIAAPIVAPATVSPSLGTPPNSSPSSSSSSLSSGAVVGIVVGAVCGVGILACLLISFVVLRRRRRDRKPADIGERKDEGLSKSFPHVFSVGSLGHETESSYPTVSGSAREFTFQEIVEATDNFNPHHILGEGGFGQVFSGKLPDGKVIAVKRLTRDGTQGTKEFISEVDLLSHLHHKHLVKLLGYHASARGRLLIYDLIPNGSVESHLHGIDSYDKPLDWETRVKIALGAARGLVYLHEDSNPRIIHRDFKASNILLDNDYTAKVSDFGLAKAAPDGETDHISTRVMGTFGYVAPEYAMTGHLLVKSDVYSYGVVLLELLSGRKPVDMDQPPGQENLVTWARPLLTSKQGLEQLVDPALGGRYNFDDVARVAAIASMCVQPEVSHRPFMVEVVQALKVVYQETERSSANGSDTSDIIIYDIDGRAVRRKASQDLTNTGLSREFATAAAVERSNSGFHTIDFESGVTKAESGAQSRELAKVTAAALGAGLAAAEGRSSWGSPASAPLPAPAPPPAPQGLKVVNRSPPTLTINSPVIDSPPVIPPPVIPPSPRSIRQFSPARRSYSGATTPSRSRQSPLSAASGPLDSPQSVNKDSPGARFTSPRVQRPSPGAEVKGPSPSWARRSGSLERSDSGAAKAEEKVDPTGMAPGLDYSGEMEYFDPEQPGLKGPKWARKR